MRSTVNKLAAVRAQLAALKTEEAQLCKKLKEAGAGQYNGKEHYALVTEVTQSSLDLAAVRRKLSRQFLTAHTNHTTTLQVRLYGYSKGA